MKTYQKGLSSDGYITHRLSFIAMSLLLICISIGFAQEKDSRAKDSLFRTEFKLVTALSIDPLGNVFVVDGGANEVYKFKKDGSFILKVGGAGWGNESFDAPAGIASPNGLDVYIADYGNHRVQRFDMNLNYVSSIKQHDIDVKDRLGYPKGVAVDRFGALYVIDGENTRVVKIKNNTIEGIIGGLDAGEGRLHDPSQIQISDDDIIYVLDNGSIIEFDLFGNFIQRYDQYMFKRLDCISILDNALVVLDSRNLSIPGAQEMGSLVATLPSHQDLGASEIKGIYIYGSVMVGWTEHGVFEIPFTLFKEE